MNTQVLSYAALFGVGIFLFIVGLLSPKKSTTNMQETENGVVRTEVAEKEVFKALMIDISKKIKPEQGSLEDLLRRSGYKISTPAEYHAKRMMNALIYFATVVVGSLFFGMNFLLAAVVASAAAFYGFSVPDQMIQKTIKARRKQLLREMGFGLERVSLQLSSGADIANALAGAKHLGLFGSACGHLASSLNMNKAVGLAIEEVKANLPDTPPFNEFLELIHVSISKGSSVVPSFQVSAKNMRQALKQEVIEVGERVKLKITLVTSVFMVVSTFVVVLAPALIMVIFNKGFF